MRRILGCSTAGAFSARRGAALAAAVCVCHAASIGGCASGSGPMGSSAGFAAPSGDDDGGAALVFPRPGFGPTVTAQAPPPPISGGTLLVTHDGLRAVLSDPDRDQVYLVNIALRRVDATVSVQAGDEPGRIVEDGAGRLHVVLRRGGALVDLDPQEGVILDRRDACPAPRGVAWDSSTDLVWVACATGELVALPAAGGPVAHVFPVERDLRDVLVTQGQLSVTKFRSAEVLRLGGDGSVLGRVQMPSPLSSSTPHVAWRALAGPSGTVIAVHQAESTESLGTHVEGGYGSGGCGCGAASGGGSSAGSVSAGSASSGPVSEGVSSAGSAAPSGDLAGSDPSQTDAAATPPAAHCIGAPGRPGMTWAGLKASADTPCGMGAVISVLTALTWDGTAIVNKALDGILPVDVAVSSDGSAIAVVTPGSAFTDLDDVFVFDGCGIQQASGPVEPKANAQAPIAVAFDSANDLLVQVREPAALFIYPAVASTISSQPGPSIVQLSDASRADTGHDIFHTQAGAGIACASCHPEGRDDGHVWVLDDEQRRTPSLLGTIAGTAPYHWPGDQPNLESLVNDVYTVRMAGAQLSADRMSALTGWVQAVPAPPAPSFIPADAAARGKVLFERSDVGCSGCHSGPKLTNNQNVDVGTGGTFQVPPLIGVGWRTPLLHDGCAATIADRFMRCSTPSHGSIASLSAGDVSDLVAYLETL